MEQWFAAVRRGESPGDFPVPLVETESVIVHPANKFAAYQFACFADKPVTITWIDRDGETLKQQTVSYSG